MADEEIGKETGDEDFVAPEIEIGNKSIVENQGETDVQFDQRDKDAEIAKQRALSDAELLQGGAKYITLPNGKLLLAVTKDQEEKIEESHLTWEEKDERYALDREKLFQYVEELAGILNSEDSTEKEELLGKLKNLPAEIIGLASSWGVSGAHLDSYPDRVTPTVKIEGIIDGHQVMMYHPYKPTRSFSTWDYNLFVDRAMIDMYDFENRKNQQLHPHLEDQCRDIFYAICDTHNIERFHGSEEKTN